MSTIEDLVVGIGIDADSLEADAEKAKGIFDSAFAKITAATAGAGAGLEAFARGQQDSNAQTRQLAASLGISEGAMRDLAGETANVGFPLNEVLDLMELGKQQGLKSSESLKSYAEFWDKVGDATGESATELGKAGTALQTMGVDVGHEADALDALGFIQEKTTSTQSDFLGLLGRIGPELNDVGLGINGTAALLGAMEQELGLTGRAARTQLSSALKESDGDLGKMMKTLGLTEEQFNQYSSAVEGSGAVIERNSAIVDEGFTPLQKLSNEAKELAFQYGGLSDVAGMLAPVLMSVGPIMMIASKATTFFGMATKGLSAAMTFLAANPIVLVIAIIVALVAAFVLAYKNSETFRKIVDTALRAVGAAAMWLWENAFKPAFAAIGAVVMWLWNNVLKPAWAGIKVGFNAVSSIIADWVARGRAAFQAVAAVVTWLVERVKASIAVWKSIFAAVGAVIVSWVDKAKSSFTSVIGFFQGIPGKIRSALSSLASTILSPFRSAFNSIASAWNNTVGRLSFSIPSWVPGIGGNSWSAPTLPYFHTGGIVGGSGDQMIMARGGEGVFTRDQMAALGGGGQIVIRSDGTRLSEAIVEIIAMAVRQSGPSVINIPGTAA